MADDASKLDEAIDELKKLVNLATTSQTILNGMSIALTGRSAADPGVVVPSPDWVDPGTPGGGGGGGAGGKIFDEFTDEIRKLVDLTTISVTLQSAMVASLTGLQVSIPSIKSITGQELPPNLFTPPGEKRDKLNDPFYEDPVTMPGRFGGGGTGGADDELGEDDDKKKKGKHLDDPGGATTTIDPDVADPSMTGHVKRRLDRRISAAKSVVGKYIGKPLSKLADTRVGRGLGSVGRGIASAGKGIADTKLGRGLGSVGRGIAGSKVGRMVGGIAGGATPVVGLGVGFGVVLGEATKALTHWTAGVLDSTKHLAKVSGEMAAVHAERDVQQMLRDINRGEAIGESAGGLAESEAKILDTLQPALVTLENMGNKLLTFLLDIVEPPLSVLISMLESMYEALRQFIKAVTAILPGVDEKDIGAWGGGVGPDAAAVGWGAMFGPGGGVGVGGPGAGKAAADAARTWEIARRIAAGAGHGGAFDGAIAAWRAGGVP